MAAIFSERNFYQVAVDGPAIFRTPLPSAVLQRRTEIFTLKGSFTEFPKTFFIGHIGSQSCCGYLSELRMLGTGHKSKGKENS